MTKHAKIALVETGVHTLIALKQLIKSPRNVRKVPHTKDAIEAYAASFAAKGILQNLVVEPEIDEGGVPTGRYLVTIGEGRRLGQCLRVERGEITDDELIPCVIDTLNNPEEISLDENVTREAMHPADQFDAFRKLNEEGGHSAEDIAARFGVSARIVKQRLRLGAVSPRLMQDYRDDKLTLEQLTAFCVSDNHARQEAVYEGLASWHREPYYIRRMMTEATVNSDDRRAKLVGIEPYEKAGGRVTRDLFSEDDGGYFEDAVLLEKLAVQHLTDVAASIQAAEGWKWAEAYIDFPYQAGMRRAFQKVVEISVDETATLRKAKADLSALSEEYEDFHELPDEVDVEMTNLEIEIARIHALAHAYDPADIARAGVIVSLLHDGRPKIERGLIRAEDWDADAQVATEDGEDDPKDEGGDGGDFRDDQETGGDETPELASPRLSDAFIRDLTAHRTVAIRLALGEQPELAARALAHLLVLDTFYAKRDGSCLEIRPTSTDLAGWMEDYSQSSAVEAIQVRHDAWAERLPQPEALWPYVLAMDPEDLGLLIAHCVALTVNVVRQPFGIRTAEAFGNDLATSLALDVGAHWRPTARCYFSRVTKDHIVSAVREAVSDEAADRLSKLKKPQMAEAAEQVIAPTGWLPPLMRVAPQAEVPDVVDNLPEAAE
jgi:ParB family chromosome partitioning protein